MQNSILKTLFILLLSIFYIPSYAQGNVGLIGKWTFNGNANDESGNGLNGILRGVIPDTGANGLPNTAYRFDGSSSYITVPYNPLMNQMVHSFCALVKPMGFYSGPAQGNAIIWRGAENTSTFSYQLEYFDNAYDNSDAIYSPTQDVFAGWTGNQTGGSPQTAWYYTPTVVANTWYSVVLTYDGDTTKIYVNGEQKCAFNNPCSYTPSTDSLNFGKGEDGPGWPFWMNGVVDEIRFYNRVLSAAEVNMFGDSLGVNNVLPIKFYLDANSNCIKDNGENYNLLPLTVRIDSENIPVDTISTTSGLYYHANGHAGTVYSFHIISADPNVYLSCPAGGVLYDTLVSGVNATKYAGLSCTGNGGFDLETHMASSTDPHAQTICITIDDKDCTPVPASLTVQFSPKYVYSSALPAPVSVSGNTATWNFSSFSYLTSPKSIHLIVTAPGNPLTGGDTVHTRSIIIPFAGDADTTDNTDTRTDTIHNCYDPNSITVSPNSCVTPNVPATLQYAIQFENTGNDTAHHIYILDTLANELNGSTLKIVAASNVMNVSKWNDPVYHTIYKFEFPEINLLDSSHHNECTGMVLYNINTIPGLTQGTIIANHAGIYFDDNPVVLTDTAFLKVGCPEQVLQPVANESVSLYPNPANNEITMNSGQTIQHIVIANSLGQTVYTKQCDARNIKIDTKDFTPGVYFIIVNNLHPLMFTKQAAQ